MDQSAVSKLFSNICRLLNPLFGSSALLLEFGLTPSDLAQDQEPRTTKLICATRCAIDRSLLVAALGEQSLPISGDDNRESCAAGQRQRLLNQENFSHIVNKNEGQYRGSNQNARFVGVDR